MSSEIVARRRGTEDLGWLLDESSLTPEEWIERYRRAIGETPERFGPTQAVDQGLAYLVGFGVGLPAEKWLDKYQRVMALRDRISKRGSEGVICGAASNEDVWFYDMNNAKDRMDLAYAMCEPIRVQLKYVDLRNTDG